MSKKAFEHIDKQKMQPLIDIKKEYLTGKISMEDAAKRVKDTYGSITPEEFAYTEQTLKEEGFSDDAIHEQMDNLISLLDGVLEKPKLKLSLGHPIQTYILENKAVKALLDEIKDLQKQHSAGTFDKAEWEAIYNKLNQFNTHLARKQNQLFPKLEEKGFDRPSKIMWTFDNEVKKIIGKAKSLLESGNTDEFLKTQETVIELTEDIIDKEESILFPTAMELLTDAEFVQMRKGDDEIGYCLIENPPPYGQDSPSAPGAMPQNFVNELGALFSKYGFGGEGGVLDVKQGKLTLQQINLIFQHLPVDLSFVDENELVRFYSDTKHRVFPRSPGVIGREVANCHPRESVATVERIIKAFRSGEKDEAEFWLQMGGKFIYILYIAVRDENGVFKGVLEMMQDATHIRSLEGSQRLLSWDESGAEAFEDRKKEASVPKNEFGLTKDSIIGDIIKAHPYIKEFLPTVSPKYKKLLNPVAFNMIAKFATLEMAAERGGVDLSVLIEKICTKIRETERCSVS